MPSTPMTHPWGDPNAPPVPEGMFPGAHVLTWVFQVDDRDYTIDWVVSTDDPLNSDWIGLHPWCGEWAACEPINPHGAPFDDWDQTVQMIIDYDNDYLEEING